MTRNVVAEPTTATADALSSWRDAPARQAILEFVARVTGADGSAPVPDDERVAVFDNDGPMLDVAQHADRPFLRLLLANDDADRELGYTAGAEKVLDQADRHLDRRQQEGTTGPARSDRGSPTRQLRRRACTALSDRGERRCGSC